MKTARLCIAAAFVAAPAAVQATPLNVVKVTSDVACVFDPACKVFVSDTVGDIVIPAMTGKAFLQSRTFSGAPGAPGDGLTGYEYRIDLTQAVTQADSACIIDMTIDYGPLAKLNYDKSGPDDDVYVIVKGGLGSIGIFSADMTDTKITFVFDQPVCAGAEGGKGQTTYFFGLASKAKPMPGVASVTVAGFMAVDVKDRVTTH